MHILKKNQEQNEEHRKMLLFGRMRLDIRTPPGTSLRTGTTPLINAGGKDAYRVGTANYCLNSSVNSNLPAYREMKVGPSVSLPRKKL